MSGDFSRLTFDPEKQYTKVLMQQGRVQLDADWNEQAAILAHYLEQLAADLIGPFGGPVDGLGFEVTPYHHEGTITDLKIGKGRYYVEGLLVENLAEQARYGAQPNLADANDLPAPPFLSYLDVWERLVTYREDDSIREVALGGPDTAVRAQVVWQVRVADQAPGKTAFPTTRKEFEEVPWQDWVDVWQPPHRGSLKARARPDGDPAYPTVAAPDMRYRGLENQLYRVEVHAPGTARAGATFKWSRDGGSVAFSILDLATDGGTKRTTVSLEHLGHEGRPGLASGAWVEIVDDRVVLGREAGPLLEVTAVDSGRAQVTLRGTPDPGAGADRNLHPLLRRWDHGSAARIAPSKDGALPIVEGHDHWLDLEDGIQVSFQPAPEGHAAQVYRSGDYWLIPARAATGNIEWPGPPDRPGALPPLGVRHRFAPLALVVAGKRAHDLRHRFEPHRHRSSAESAPSEYEETGK
jgi:Family of unknown function (DUF6519)